MDSIKISLWLLLAMISVFRSECKSFRKYLVRNTIKTNSEHDVNCFCFKDPGDHQIVPEILNQNNNNLERLIVYLYKDKSTGKVKMYIPNEEKQALVPDLAFEVGDRLVSVDNDKIIDIFLYNINTLVDQQPYIDTYNVLPTEINKQNEIQYDDPVDYIQPQVDTGGVLSEEKHTPDIYHINLNEYNVDTDLVQVKELNKPASVIHEVTLNKQPQVDTKRVPSIFIDIPSELIYGGQDKSEATFKKDIPSITNINNFVADFQPASDWNILPEYTSHEQHELSIDFNRVPSKPINIPGEVMYPENFNDWQHELPPIDFNRLPSKPIIIPGEVMYPDTVNGGQHELPSIDFNRVPSKPIIIPGEVMYPDNVNDGQYKNPYIGTNGVLKPLNVPGETIYHDKVNNYHMLQYEQPHVDTNGVSKQINVPGEVMHPNNVNYHGLHEQPRVTSVLQPLHVPDETTYHDNGNYDVQYEQHYVDSNGFSKQINVAGEIKYPDNVNYHGQHKNPFIDNNEVSKLTTVVPSEVIYPDNANYHEQPRTDTNDESKHMHIPVEYVDDYDLQVYYEQGIPSKSSEHTLIMDDKPDGIWNIPPEWIYKHTIDPDKYGNEYVYNIHGGDKNRMPLKSSEESEETKSSTEHKSIEAITESGLNRKDFRVEIISKSNEANNENNLIEYSQSNISEYSNKNEINESSEKVNYNDELEINAVKEGLNKDKTKSPNHSNNQYETFDRWFIHQMERFQTFTEHDKAFNIATIERYILNILKNNGMHVTIEGVLTDSYGTALDLHELHLRPILIGSPLAVASIMKEKIADFVMPANMVYLQAILVTNANPSMILGIIPIGKTVIPPSARNDFSTVLRPLAPYDSSIILAKPPTRPSTYQTQFPSGSGSLDAERHIELPSPSVSSKDITRSEKKKPLALQLASTKHLPVNANNKLGHTDGRTVITFVKKTPVIVHHRHRQPVKSVKINVPGNEMLNFVSKNSEEAVNELVNSLSGPKGPLSSADATNKLLNILRSDGSLFTSSEESSESEVDEDDIGGRIVGGSAATGSGAPLSMKGRMKDF